MWSVALPGNMSCYGLGQRCPKKGAECPFQQASDSSSPWRAALPAPHHSRPQARQVRGSMPHPRLVAPTRPSHHLQKQSALTLETGWFPALWEEVQGLVRHWEEVGSLWSL